MRPASRSSAAIVRWPNVTILIVAVISNKCGASLPPTSCLCGINRKHRQFLASYSLVSVSPSPGASIKSCATVIAETLARPAPCAALVAEQRIRVALCSRGRIYCRLNRLGRSRWRRCWLSRYRRVCCRLDWTLSRWCSLSWYLPLGWNLSRLNGSLNSFRCFDGHTANCPGNLEPLSDIFHVLLHAV